MADLVLAGVTIPPLTAADPGDAGAWTPGTYYALPPIGRAPREADPEYDERDVAFAGVDGVGTKRLGFRGRDIDADLVFLAADAASARAARDGLLAALRAGRFGATVPGGTARPSCRLRRGGFRDVRSFTLGGRYCLLCAAGARQLALS